MIQYIKNLPPIKDWRIGRYWRLLVKRGQQLSLESQSEKMEYPIDFVVTWVDGADPIWQAEKEKYERAIGIVHNHRDNGEERYRDWEIFKYWFRAVEKYAPWVRRIYLVTCGQVPEWLDLNAPKLELVTHKEIMPENALPTFNSSAIEFNLHRISGLSEHFVYFNDDMFLNRPVKKEDFFRGGLPNYTAIAAPLINETNCAFDHMLYTVNGAINNKFRGDISRRIVDNPEKWFASCYDERVDHNVYAAQRGYLPGMYFSHLAAPFRKSTIEKIWGAFPTLMEQTTIHRFRNPQDAQHQIISLWDILEGDFNPVSVEHHGRLFWNPVKQEQQIIDAILNEKYISICINDSEIISKEDFLALKAELGAAFAKAFPEKSSFEK